MWALAAMIVIFLPISLETNADNDTLFCNESLLGREGSGVIQSFNYPFDYRHNLTCTYRINVDHVTNADKTICFSFQRFDLEDSTPFCSFDYLRFEETKYCGAGLWQYGVPTGTTESNVWYSNFCWPVKGDHFDITFHTDNNLNGRGFYATYKIHEGVSAHHELPQYISGQAPCSSGEWTCFNRKCISINGTCDAQDSCGDGSDESYAHTRCGEQSLLACDFSNKGSLSDGLCGFTQEGGEWYRTDSRTSLYGPNGDHTNGSYGFYMYTDGVPGPAYLVSAEIMLSQASTHCLSFWYFVYGSPVAATLHVFISEEQTYTRAEWSRSGDQVLTSTWLRGQINLSGNTPLQVMFGADLGSVALDDISVLPGECRGDDISCNFESGLCGWKTANEVDMLLGTLQWRPHSRTDATVGPLYDRSSMDGSGQYLLLSSAGDSVVEPRGMVVSPGVAAWPQQARCLHISYYMAGLGPDCCTLRMWLYTSNGRLRDAIWTQNAAQRGMWKEASLTITQDKSYQVVLEGVIDNSLRGEIALDSIYMQMGACEGSTEGATCQAGEYMCTDGSCIPASVQCDGIMHCQDGSDEDWKAGCQVSTSTTSVSRPTCETDHFQCSDGSKCVPLTWVCDHFDDCPDRSDETNPSCLPATDEVSSSPRPACGEGEFSCRNGACISIAAICEGRDSCGDGSESKANCSLVGQVSCGSGEMQCVSINYCVPAHQVCDGTNNCADGSDEDPEIAGCKLVMSSSGLGLGAAIGIGVAILLVILILLINILIYRRHKQQRQSEHHTNTSSSALAGDVSTISYSEGYGHRQYDPNGSDHIYETLMEPPDDHTVVLPVRPPPYLPRSHHHNLAYIPSDISSTPPTPPPPNNPNRHLFLPLHDDPPPPYDQIIKDAVILAPTSHMASQWLQPATSV